MSFKCASDLILSWASDTHPHSSPAEGMPPNIGEKNPVPGLRCNVYQRDMRKVTPETTFLIRQFWPQRTAWASARISYGRPAFWQLQFFLFQFQFVLIFKILISEMYAVIVLPCLAVYLCCFCMLDWFLPPTQQPGASARFPGAISAHKSLPPHASPSHLTKMLSWASTQEAHVWQRSNRIWQWTTFQKKAWIRQSWIWSGQGKWRHSSVFLFKMDRYPCGKTVRELHRFIKY